MTIDNKFKLQQEVYLKTDPDQQKRLVTAITIRGNNLEYELMLADNFPTHHQEFEISDNEDTLMKVK